VVQQVQGGIPDRGLSKLGRGIGKGMTSIGIGIIWAWLIRMFLKQASYVMPEELVKVVTVVAVGQFAFFFSNLLFGK
jgi:hypothetical protein